MGTMRSHWLCKCDNGKSVLINEHVWRVGDSNSDSGVVNYDSYHDNYHFYERIQTKLDNFHTLTG